MAQKFKIGDKIFYYNRLDRKIHPAIVVSKETKIGMGFTDPAYSIKQSKKDLFSFLVEF